MDRASDGCRIPPHAASTAARWAYVQRSLSFCGAVRFFGPRPAAFGALRDARETKHQRALCLRVVLRDGKRESANEASSVCCIFIGEIVNSFLRQLFFNCPL